MKRFWMAAGVLVWAAAWAWALPPIPETLDRAQALRQAAEAARETAPDAQTLMLAQARYVVYEPDGASTLWVEFWAKALTEKGARELRDVPVWYKEGFSEAEFQQAEVIRADGSADPVDLAANVHAATSNSGTEVNIYDQTSKRLVLTIPQMAAGDTLHVVLAQRTNRPRIPDTFSDFETFESMEGPTPYASLTIVSPKELPLRSTALLGEVAGTVTTVRETLPDGRIRHRWVARNVPQTFAEANMPKAETQLQRVVVSTFASWEELSKWYWGLCLPHLKTTPAIEAKVRELTEGKTREAQIAALFGFVAQKIRYMGIIAEDKAPGYEPHDVALTFDNRYGVCRDKGALLVAMLRSAGFKAFPVLINAGSKRDREVPVPYFNHAIVAIDNGKGEYTLLDPTDDTARAELPAYLSGCTYLVTRPEGDTLRLTPVPPPNENAFLAATDVALQADGSALLSATLDFRGLNDNIYRPLFVKLAPDRARDRFDGFLKRVVPGAELTAFEVSPKDAKDIRHPLQVKLSARIPGFALPDASGRTLITLPFLSRTIGLVNFLFDGLDQPERKYEWEIDAPCAARETLRITGLKRLGAPELLPEDPNLITNGARFTLTCTPAPDGDALELVRELALTQKTYSPEGYQDLRRFAARMTRVESVHPLFRKTAGQNDDALVLNWEQHQRLLPDGRLRTRDVRETRVLTFQGKRSQGEVKLVYNPAWQNLTLNTAEVRTAAGDVVSITPKEINELDADGAALSPRYPFTRQRILSLPAVEVGSTIRLDYERESRDKRPFVSTVVFASASPIERRVYTLTLPLERAADLRVAERNMAGADVARSVVTNGSEVVYSWTLRSLPAVRPEPATPAAACFRPTLYLALREAAAHRVVPRLAEAAEAALEAGSEKAEAAAKALRKGLENPTEEALLRAIQTFAARRIRLLGPAWTELPFTTFTPPDRTLADGYGNRMDALLLRLAMFRAVGIRADLVFASDQSLEAAFTFRETFATRAVPRWTRWTRPYLRLEDGRLVGDEGEFDEPGAAAVSTRSLMTASGRMLYSQPEALRSHTENTLRIVVAPTGEATLASETFAWGLAAGQFRKAERETTPELRRRTVAALAEQLMPGAEPISEYVVDTAAYPVRARLAVEARAYATRQGNLLSIPLGQLIGACYGLRGASRENPIWQSEAEASVRTVDLWLPKGAEILSRPEPFEVTLPGGGTLSLTCEEAPRLLSGMQRLTYRVVRTETPPAVLESWFYPALVELDRRLLAPAMGTLVLRLAE